MQIRFALQVVSGCFEKQVITNHFFDIPADCGGEMRRPLAVRPPAMLFSDARLPTLSARNAATSLNARISIRGFRCAMSATRMVLNTPPK